MTVFLAVIVLEHLGWDEGGEQRHIPQRDQADVGPAVSPGISSCGTPGSRRAVPADGSRGGIPADNARGVVRHAGEHPHRVAVRGPGPASGESRACGAPISPGK